MSRIGKKPVKLESGAKAAIDGRQVTISGPKGQMAYTLPEGITIQADAKQLSLDRTGTDRQSSMYLGLARSLLQGMVVGVTTGYKKSLEIQGVGFRGQLAGQKLTLSLGFSHPVVYDVPAGIKVSMPDQTHIHLEGVDKQLVGETAACIRRFRPPDAYKGKGVRYAGEQISLKEGKTVG